MKNYSSVSNICSFSSDNANFTKQKKKTLLSQILINREIENFNIKFTESIKENRKEKTI